MDMTSQGFESSATRAASIRASIELGTNRITPTAASLKTFNGLADSGEHVAIEVPGGPSKVPLVRIHSECLTGDVFGSRRCDCGPQLDEAMSLIANGGILLYLRQEGRGIGLYNKIDSYVLQDTNIDTFTANTMLGRGEDERAYLVAAQMLYAMDVQRVRLLTNNPKKTAQLISHGIDVTEIVPTSIFVNAENAKYLHDKENLGGHTLFKAVSRGVQ